MQRKPKTLETKAKLLELVLNNRKLFSCEYGGYAPYYKRGTFIINNEEFRFHWQNYVSRPHVISEISISTVAYKTVYPKKVKELLNVAKCKVRDLKT